MTVPSLKALALAASVAILSACATATPYQPSKDANARNGYSELQIEKDRARVTFDGNSLTDRETVETYLLYRAAELTKAKGYDHFILTERNTDENKKIRSTGYSSPYHGFFNYSYYHPRFGWSDPFYDPFFPSFRRYGLSAHSRYRSPFYNHWRHANEFDTREITRYKASAEVKFGYGSKPSSNDNAFDAADVLSNLGPKIVFPEVET